MAHVRHQVWVPACAAASLAPRPRLHDHEVEVDWFIAELREANRRRPRLQQEFDRAGLP
ncbi:MAG: hypothetical protein ACRDNS_35140 [Trebonia sp.]